MEAHPTWIFESHVPNKIPNQMAWWHVLKKKHFAFQPPIPLIKFQEENWCDKTTKSPNSEFSGFFLASNYANQKKAKSLG